MGLFEILKGEQPGFIKTLLNDENAGQFGEFSTEYALTNHNLPGEPVVLKNVYVAVFVIHNIEQESSIIGALYALGLKSRQLILHYLLLPVLVGMVLHLLLSRRGH